MSGERRDDGISIRHLFQDKACIEAMDVVFSLPQGFCFGDSRRCRAEMTDIATGRQPRPPDLDKFPAAFSVVGEKQEKAADEETLVLLQRFSGNRGVEKARAEFEMAQEVEERFLHDFDGVDFTMRYLARGILPTHKPLWPRHSRMGHCAPKEGYIQA